MERDFTGCYPAWTQFNASVCWSYQESWPGQQHDLWGPEQNVEAGALVQKAGKTCLASSWLLGSLSQLSFIIGCLSKI